MRYAYLAATAILAASACAPVAELEEGSPEDVAAGYGYFQVRHDFRKCAYPMCGGYWVARVNQATTRCSGGAYEAECYVAELDLDGAPPGIEAGSVQLAHGRMSTRRFGEMGRFGVLNVDLGYSAASEVIGEGTFYGLMDNGIRCITAPCFSLDASKLNSSSRVRRLSYVDASTVAITPGFEARVWEQLGFGEVIAVGEIVTVRNPGPDDKALIANQLYVPALPPTPASQVCSVDAECGSGIYHTFVNDPAECYCTACSVPLNAEAAIANEASFAQHCGDFDRTSCPQVRCSQPRPTYCDTNLACSFTP
jgi:hypothetical protein